MQYPPDIRVIRVMCTGRIDPGWVFRAFSCGVDGILAVGCKPGECHYVSGNFQAESKLGMASRVLGYVGVDRKRLAFEHCSSAEAARFCGIVTEFTNRIKELGPIGQAEGLSPEAMKRKLRAARRAAESEKLRWLAGKHTEFMDKGNKYGEVFTQHEFGRLLDATIMDEMAIKEMTALLGEKPLSVKQLSKELGLAPPRVLRYLSALVRKEQVAVKEIRDRSPLYAIRSEVS
jgi:coenzyme F420-reducing hydrogenase delta subunit